MISTTIEQLSSLRSKTITWICVATLIAVAGCSNARNAADTRPEDGSSIDQSTAGMVIATLEQKGAPLAVGADSLDRGLDSADIAFTVNRHSDGGVSVYLVGDGSHSRGGHSSVSGITRIDVVFHAPDGALLGSVSTNNVESSGTRNTSTGTTSSAVSAHVFWSPQKPVEPGTRGIATITGKDGIIRRLLDLPALPTDAGDGRRGVLDVVVDTETRGTMIEFLVRVTRNAPPPPGEYLPNSEKIRIEIRDGGETIWNSSDGMMFTQALGAVEPSRVGDEVVHRLIWDGRHATTNERVGPGRFDLIVTIPARPTPYVFREEFRYSGR